MGVEQITNSFSLDATGGFLLIRCLCVFLPGAALDAPSQAGAAFWILSSTRGTLLPSRRRSVEVPIHLPTAGLFPVIHPVGWLSHQGQGCCGHIYLSARKFPLQRGVKIPSLPTDLLLLSRQSSRSCGSRGPQPFVRSRASAGCSRAKVVGMCPALRFPGSPMSLPLGYWAVYASWARAKGL